MGGGQEMSARGAWAGLGAAQGGGAEGQACAERGPELSSDPLSQLQKEHLSACSCRRPGHRLLFSVPLSETFLFAGRHGDARAEETRASSRRCYGGRDPQCFGTQTTLMVSDQSQ